MDAVDAFIDIVLNAIAELVAGIVNLGLRKLGFSEVEARTIKKWGGRLLALTAVLFLFWLTFRYS